MSAKPALTPSLVAKVKSLAESNVLRPSGNITIEQDVLERIRNCLKRANHPETPEKEAQTALRMSSRLMERYNVAQADLIAAEMESQAPSTRADQSVVSITKAKPKAKNTSPAWLNRVTVALLEELDSPEITFEICKDAIRTAIEFVKPSEKVKDKTWIEDVVDSYNHDFFGDMESAHLQLVSCIRQAVRISEPGGSVRGEKWSETLGSAMSVFFDCKDYTSSRMLSVDFIFYGIGVNTAAAAMAFETTFNLIEHWALMVKGDKGSYRLGVADGLWKIAHQEKENEFRRVQEREAASLAEREQDEHEARQRELNRMMEASKNDPVLPERSRLPGGEVHVQVEAADSPGYDLNEAGENDDESDPNELSFRTDDEDNDDDESGHDEFRNGASTLNLKSNPVDEIRLDPKREFSPVLGSSLTHSVISDSYLDRAQREADKTSGMLWRDSGALTLYRKNATTIAEDYLRDKGPKLGTGPKRTARVRDHQAYQKGKEDSKKIDVKRRRLEN